MKSLAFAFLLVIVPCAFGAERTVAPTWLHRKVADAPEKPTDISTPSCHYKAIFGAGDSETR
ncbi:MAG TPA: hypothetical protein VGW37_12825, partial [Terriglobia bacterium]|nr:hypothetical protein [Terriglobia bacterium]